MSVIIALVFVAAFLLSIQPLPPVRYLIATAIFAGLLFFAAADDPPKHAPATPAAYRAEI